MRWKCKACGVEHEELPICFGAEAPWRSLVPENEFAQRVELTEDQCVVDESVFSSGATLRSPSSTFLIRCLSPSGHH